MIDDKLSSDQRIRLEALTLAGNISIISTPEQIIETASRFEKYVKNGET